MANFLQSAMSNYQRGWNQAYGPSRRPGPMADPVANNPAIGAPLGARDDRDFNPNPGWDPKNPNPPYRIPFTPQGPIWQEQPPPTYPQPTPARPVPPLPSPVANNPAMGQPLGAYDNSQQPNYQPSSTSLSPQDQLLMLMPWLMAARAGGAPVNSNPEMGAPRGSGSGDHVFLLPIRLSHNPEVGQFDIGSAIGGVASSAQSALDSSALSDVSGGGGGGSNILSYLQSVMKGSGSGSGGKQGGLGGELGGIFSAFANQPTFTYAAPNLPLPKPATFGVPNLPPNQDWSY